ncbi:MAG: hypothetical protein C4518_02620 [Desulfobacteraceae bacterium]|nr:MAG: hypothetical protein C4518_02620 [Desulfobacteraceae bacterium]
MHKQLSSLPGKYKLIIGLTFIVLMAATVYILVAFDLFHQITALINENTPPELFVGLMLVLPLAGVPMSFFLLFLGAKFGILTGLLILEILLPIHMIAAYVVAHAVRKPLVFYLVNRKHYQIPMVPEHHELMFSFFFISFPAFPYAVKLYLMPLAGVRFRYCVWLNWAVQGILCIPFVFLGKSAIDLNVEMFGITLVIFVILFIFLRWAKKRYLAIQKTKLS